MAISVKLNSALGHLQRAIFPIVIQFHEKAL